MLHKLPNGVWIRLADVIAITPLDKIYDYDRLQVIIAHSGTATQVPFETFAAAQAYADELAALVNEARSEP